MAQDVRSETTHLLRHALLHGFRGRGGCCGSRCRAGGRGAALATLAAQHTREEVGKEAEDGLQGRRVCMCVCVCVCVHEQSQRGTLQWQWEQHSAVQWSLRYDAMAAAMVKLHSAKAREEVGQETEERLHNSIVQKQIVGIPRDIGSMPFVGIPPASRHP